jgi:16S rRNA C967 or C1407 C5-methylase (RsmB/RsmF family)/NOL1/NOP2/fmu family ribosome biogenesis protein
MNSLTDVKGFDKEAFVRVHSSGEQVTSVRINPLKVPPLLPVPSVRIPWTKYGYYLEERPSFTFDPFFHAGCYYVQEASSMFLEQALSQTMDLSQPLKVLDLCGAPGGKSTHIQSLISSESLLVSNEVIRSRALVLNDNIVKWGCQNVVVTNNDPKDFAALKGYFDVIVIDAPCSGSGLFRRDPEAIEEWGLNNVHLCSQRQQRILADVWPSLKEGGVLIYSTCSFSKEEDEQIADWMIESLRDEASASSVRLRVQEDWKVVEIRTALGAYCYRFWPYKLKGEGFFIACFRKTGESEEVTMKIKKRPEPVNKKDLEIINNWVQHEGLQFVKHDNTVYGWPVSFVNDITGLLNYCHVMYSGTIIGELLRDKLVPDHALALSKLVNDSINRIPLDLEQSIRYLQRKDLTIDIDKKGWQLVSYEGQILGWVNVLPNRINNYYPKEMRILKDN